MVARSTVHPNGVADVTVSLTTPGCPIRGHFENAVRHTSERSTASPLSTSSSTSSATARRRRSAEARPRQPAGGPLAQVGRTSSASAPARAGSASPPSPPTSPAALAAEGRGWACSTPTSGATRSRACSASGPSARRSRRAQDHPARVPWREGHVDRLLRRGGRRRRLARADAPQGADPVPRGCRLGRTGLPARRPAARHRRRLDDARPAAPRLGVRPRDDAAADCAEGRQAVRRHGREGLDRRSAA